MAIDKNRAVNVIIDELDARVGVAEADSAKPWIYFTAANVSVTEGNSGTKTLTLTARRSSLSGTHNALGNFVQGSTTGADFAGGALPGQKTWAFMPGSDTATVDIVINGDTDVEGDETFGYQLLAGSGYKLGTPSSVTGTILNDDVPQTGSEFSMTQLPVARMGYPRIAKTGGGASAGSGTLSPTLNITKAGTIYARTRSTANGNPILQPAYLAVTNAPIGNGPVAIPNIDARPEAQLLDLSPDGVTWILGTTPFQVGAMYGYFGQSLMVDMFVRRSPEPTMDTVGETPTTLGAAYFGGWQKAGTPGNPPTSEGAGNSTAGFDSAGGNAFIRLMSAKLGCAVFLVGKALGSTDTPRWVPGQTLHTDLLTILAEQADNRIEGLFQYLGHDNALNGQRTGFNMISDMDAIMASIDAQMVDKTYTRYVATIPNISNGVYGSITNKVATRIAGKVWCERNPRAVSVEMDDLKLFQDGLHDGQSANQRVGYHWVRSIAQDDIGPRFSGVPTKAGRTITLPISVGNGATALSVEGDLKKRLAVFKRGNIEQNKRLEIQSVALGGVNAGKANLAITLTTDPGDINLELWVNPKDDPDINGDTNLIINNATADGIPVGRHFTSLRPSHLSYATPLVLSNTPTYGPNGAFGLQGLSGGFGVADSARGPIILPSGAEDWRVECFVYVASGSTDNTIFQIGGRLLMVHNYDLRTNNGDLLKEKAFNQGLNHFSWSQHGSTAIIHINGQPVLNSGGPAGYNDDSPLIIRAGQTNGFLTGKDITLSQVAIFLRAHVNEAITPPTAAYTGTEAHLLNLWALNGTAVDSAVRV